MDSGPSTTISSIPCPIPTGRLGVRLAGWLDARGASRERGRERHPLR
ncbi:MAG TPA: hypothetical protein VMV08_00535 [Gaiellaceae bacterium]|nr:hypothetical protein [Gaiellaceae bacterium]